MFQRLVQTPVAIAKPYFRSWSGTPAAESFQTLRGCL